MFVAVRDAIITWAGYPDLLSGLGSLGVKSLELAIPKRERTEFSGKMRLMTALGLDLSKEEERRRLEETLSAEDISVCALLIDNDFAEENLDTEVEYVAEACRAAHELGVEVIRINAVMKETPGLSLQGYQRRALQGVEACLKRTEGLKVNLAVENHGVIGNRYEFLFRLFKEAGTERLGLTLDTGNLYWYGYPLEEVYEIAYGLAPYVRHTHIKNGTAPAGRRDAKRSPRDIAMAPLYEGDIDLKAIVETLKDAGYDSDLTIEDESLGQFTPEERKSTLKKDVEHLRGLLDH